MLSKIKENEGLLFIVKIITVYIVWTFIRETFNNVSFLEPIWWSFNDYFAAKYVAVSSWCLENWFNYDLIYNKRNILPSGSLGVYVGNHCLGISAKFIFIGIILSLKGKWFHKIWFTILGLGIIVLINFARILMLAKQLTEGKHFLFDLNHKYIYVVFVYGVIFGLIMIWEKYFANSK
ncbi:MAG: hypothetical protein ACPGVH_04225 [Chitinophagales bacterium]